MPSECSAVLLIKLFLFYIGTISIHLDSNDHITNPLGRWPNNNLNSSTYHAPTIYLFVVTLELQTTSNTHNNSVFVICESNHKYTRYILIHDKQENQNTIPDDFCRVALLIQMCLTILKKVELKIVLFFTTRFHRPHYK